MLTKNQQHEHVHKMLRDCIRSGWGGAAAATLKKSLSLSEKRRKTALALDSTYIEIASRPEVVLKAWRHSNGLDKVVAEAEGEWCAKAHSEPQPESFLLVN